MKRFVRSMVVVGCLGVTGVGGVTAVAQYAGGAPKGDPCGASAAHRQDTAQLLRQLDNRSASGRETASGFKRIESKLRTAIVQSSDDDESRQQLQDLYDDLSAARAATETDSDQQPEAIALLKDRLAVFTRKC